LPNRSLFIDRLEQAMPRAARSRRQLALMFIDLDRLKDVNDSLGHDAGDDAPRQAAGRIAAATPSAARINVRRLMPSRLRRDDERACAIGARTTAPGRRQR
jgi:diguanylate cyclase (GGDEF)-like protein